MCLQIIRRSVCGPAGDWETHWAGVAFGVTGQLARLRLGFVTIHPFEDGNGRVSRAIADLVLGVG